MLFNSHPEHNIFTIKKASKDAPAEMDRDLKVLLKNSLNLVFPRQNANPVMGNISINAVGFVSVRATQVMGSRSGR